MLHPLPGESLQACQAGLACSRPAVQCFSTTGTCLRPPSEAAAGTHSAQPCPLKYCMHTRKGAGSLDGYGFCREVPVWLLWLDLGLSKGRGWFWNFLGVHLICH